LEKTDSYNQLNYQVDSSGNIQQLASVPGFSNSVLYGLPPRTITQPAGWSFLGDKLLGTEARTGYVAGNFLGTGVPVAVGIGLFTNTTATNQVQVVVGTSSFNIGSAGTYPTGSASKALAVLAADFNGDGRADIVTFNGTDVSLMLMNADGSLAAPTLLTLPASGYPYFSSGTAYDFNGDGKMDLAVVNQNGPLIILLGNGDGTFQPPATLSTCTTSGGGVLAVAAGDLNGDGKADLAVACTAGVSVHFGNGNGTFQAAQTVSTGGEEVDHIAIGDVNNDGKPDIVAVDANVMRLLLVLLNAGGGTFPNVARYTLANETDDFFLTDFDWDGNLDVVFGQGHPDLLGTETSFPMTSVFFNNGDGTFRAPKATLLQGTPVSIVTGDFNGDGKLDAAVTVQQFFGPLSLQVFLGQGNGNFTGQTPNTDSNAATWTLSAAADFNRDGKLDLAALRVDNSGAATVVIYPGKGDGTFPTSISTSVSASANGMAVGDVNGDGIPDVVVTNGTLNTVSILLGKGDGTFQTATSAAAGSNPGNPVLIDVNGDGKLDLVVVNPGTADRAPIRAASRCCSETGTGRFKPPRVTRPAQIRPPSPWAISMATASRTWSPRAGLTRREATSSMWR
jgi:hypothetical protein